MKKCIIMGNGPSLNKVDFQKLKEIDTFSVNSSYQDYEKWDFHPTYYSIIDWWTIKGIKDELIEFIKNDDKIKNFFIQEYEVVKGEFDFDDRVTYIKTQWLNEVGGPIESRINFPKGQWVEEVPKYVSNITLLPSVVPYTIQLALSLGYDEIGLVGVDARYSPSGINHYKKDYFTTKSFSPSAGNDLGPYKTIGDYCQRVGVKVFSCTEGSNVNGIYKYMDYIEFINKE